MNKWDFQQRREKEESKDYGEMWHLAFELRVPNRIKNCGLGSVGHISIVDKKFNLVGLHKNFK